MQTEKEKEKGKIQRDRQTKRQMGTPEKRG